MQYYQDISLQQTQVIDMINIFGYATYMMYHLYSIAHIIRMYKVILFLHVLRSWQK